MTQDLSKTPLDFKGKITDAEPISPVKTGIAGGTPPPLPAVDDTNVDEVDITNPEPGPLSSHQVDDIVEPDIPDDLLNEYQDEQDEEQLSSITIPDIPDDLIKEARQEISDEELLNADLPEIPERLVKEYKKEESFNKYGDKISGPEAFGIGVLQGITYDHADELSGKFAQVADWLYGVSAENKKLKDAGFTGDIGPTSTEEVYKEERDIERAKQDAAFEQHKVATLAGNITGGVGITLAGGALLSTTAKTAIATKAAQVGITGVKSIAAVAAAEGLLYGSGSSKAELSEGEYVDYAKDLAVAGTIGAGGGALFGAIGNKISKVYKTKKAAKLAKAAEEASEKAEQEAGTVLTDGRIQLELDEKVAETLANDREEIKAMQELLSDESLQGHTSVASEFTAYAEKIGEKFPSIKQLIPKVKEITEQAKARTKKAVDTPEVVTEEMLGKSYKEVLSEINEASVSKASAEVDPLYRLASELRNSGDDAGADALQGYIYFRNEKLEYISFLSKSSESSSKLGARSAESLNKLSMEELHKMESAVANRKDLGRLYTQFKAMKAGSELASTLAKDVSGLDVTPYMKTKDLRYVLRNADELADTNMEPVGDMVTKAVAAAQEFVIQQARGVPKLLKATKKAKLSREDMFYAITKPESKTLTAAQEKAKASWVSYFDNLADVAEKKYGFKIPRRANYLPQTSKRGADLVTAIRKRGKEIRKATFSKADKDTAFFYPTDEISHKLYSKMSKETKEIIEYRSVLENFADDKFKTFEEMLQYAKGIENDKLVLVEFQKKALGHEASATFARTGVMPDWIQEKDIEKLAHNYIINLSKAGELNDSLKTLESYVPVMESLGFKETASYIAKYLGDISGNTGARAAAKQMKALAYQLKVERSLQEGTLKDLSKVAPELVSTLFSSVYPNLMGLNLRLPLRNYTQPFTMTAADMATGTLNPVQMSYGYRKAVRAVAWAVNEQRKGGTKFYKRAKEILTEEGYAQPHIFKRDFQNTREGLRDGWVGATSRMIDKYSKIVMSLYSHSDTHNRLVTLHIADSVVDDILGAANKVGGELTSNEKSVQKMIETLPRSYRRIIKRGNPEEIRRSLRDYYISSTQLIYGKAAMSEMGREWGHMFSAMSKWPVTIASDVNDRIVRFKGERAARILAEKYLFPVLALGAAGAAIPSGRRKDELVGKSGTGLWAPIHAGLSATEIGRTPFIGAASDVAAFSSDMLSGKVSRKKAGKLGKDLGTMFLPFGGIPKAVSHIEGIITNKPKKK